MRYLLPPFLPVGGDAMSGSRRPFQGFVGIDVSKDKFDDCGIREDHLVDDDASHPLL